MQAKQRLSHAKQSGLCFNCLQPFTRNHTCSKQVCRQCQKRYHTLLHMDRQNQSINDKRSATNDPADARGSLTAEVNTYFSYMGKTRNQILLATAIVEFQKKSGQYVPCRALLDSVSQSHFITERCVEHLMLSRTQTHAKIQGISSVNTKTYHSVPLHLRSRHAGWHTTLKLPSCLTLLVTHHPPSWTQVPGRFPRTSSLLMNSLINEDTLIYLVELPYSTRCFYQAEGTSWQLSSSTRDSSWLDTLRSHASHYYTA